MIHVKTKIVGTDEESQYIKIKKYKVKHTTSAEHICLINVLVTAILDNHPEDMNINDLCKLIKENYKESRKGEK